MQRFVIKNFNVMLKHFKDIPKAIIILMVVSSLSLHT